MGVLVVVEEGQHKILGTVSAQAGSDLPATSAHHTGYCCGPAGIRHKQTSLPLDNRSGNKMCQQDKTSPEASSAVPIRSEVRRLRVVVGRRGILVSTHWAIMENVTFFNDFEIVTRGMFSDTAALFLAVSFLLWAPGERWVEIMVKRPEWPLVSMPFVCWSPGCASLRPVPVVLAVSGHDGLAFVLIFSAAANVFDRLHFLCWEWSW